MAIKQYIYANDNITKLKTYEKELVNRRSTKSLINHYKK